MVDRERIGDWDRLWLLCREIGIARKQISAYEERGESGEEEALTAYVRLNRHFQEIRTFFPDWKPDYVEDNLRWSERRIGELGKALKERREAFSEEQRRFQSLLEAHPRDAEIRYRYGEFLLSSGRTEEALRKFKETLALRPDRAEVHNAMGIAHLRMDRLKEAALEFEKVIQARPDLPEAHFNLAGVYIRLNKLRQAKSEYKKTLDLDPNHAAAHNALGVFYMGVGDSPNALPRFKRSIELEPADPAPYINLADLYLRKGNHVNGETYLREAKKRLSPDDPLYREVERKIEGLRKH